MAASSATKASAAKGAARKSASSGADKPGERATPRRGGMSSLAASLSSRADALAKRSTGTELTLVRDAGSADDGPTDSAATTDVETHPADHTVEQHAEPESAAPVTDAPAVQPPPADPVATAPATADPTPEPTPEPTAELAATSARRARARSTRSEVPRPQHGPEGRLDATGEKVVRATFELAPSLVRALAVWERDETKRVGQQVFRERVVDIAMDLLPADLPSVLALVHELPAEMRQEKGQLFSTRVRASVREKLLGLRPELRVADIKDVLMRDIYSAALYRYLLALGVDVDPQPVRV